MPTSMVSSPLGFYRLAGIGETSALIGAHARDRLIATAQVHEQIALELQALIERGGERAADQPLDMSHRTRRVARKALCDLECAVDCVAWNGFVHKAPARGLVGRQRYAHQNVHQRRWHSDDPRQTLRAAA